MPHTLPTTYIRECTDGLFYCFSKWIYIVTEGFFWTALLLGFCVALFISSVRYGTPRAFGFASFVGLIGAIFLATLQLIPWWIATGFILSGMIGIAIMLLSDR